jgi:hypothetical protein
MVAIDSLKFGFQAFQMFKNKGAGYLIPTSRCKYPFNPIFTPVGVNNPPQGIIQGEGSNDVYQNFCNNTILNPVNIFD